MFEVAETKKALVAVLAAVRTPKEDAMKEELQSTASYGSVDRRAATIGTNMRSFDESHNSFSYSARNRIIHQEPAIGERRKLNKLKPLRLYPDFKLLRNECSRPMNSSDVN